MTRDYAKKPSAPSSGRGKKSQGSKSTKPSTPRSKAQPKSGGPSTGQWLLIVALTSGFVGFIVYLYTVPPAQPPSVLTKPPQSNQPRQSESGPEQTTDKRDYRFYELLPESEVVPPEVDAYRPDAGGDGQKYSYMLQTGSFRTAEDAERQKAQIGFQGMRAEIREVNLESGARWYRVQVGPFLSRSKMNSAIDRLVSINIQPLVRKVKQDSDEG